MSSHIDAVFGSVQPMPPTPEGLPRWRWQFIRQLTARDPLRFIHEVGDDLSIARQRLHAYDKAEMDVAELVWQTCHQCQVGLINKISVSSEWQRQGLGYRLVAYAVCRHRDYMWMTSGQSPDGRWFFNAFTAETGIDFNRGDGLECEHLNQVVLRPRTSRRARPVHPPHPRRRRRRSR